MKKGQLANAVKAMVGSTTGAPPDMGAPAAPVAPQMPVAPPPPPMKPKGKPGKGKSFSFRNPK